MAVKPAVKQLLADEDKPVAGPKLRRYRLTVPFWDNRVLHPAKSSLSFPEGEAPRSAQLLEE